MSLFTQQHYNHLARVLGTTMPEHPAGHRGSRDSKLIEIDRFLEGEWKQWEKDVREITKMLARDNPAVSIAEFIKAIHKEANT